MNRAVYRSLVSVILFLATLSVSALFGQNTGVISGTVTDPSQAVVPNATVTIVNAETGVTVWHGQTNESGVYRAPALTVGRYNITVDMQGFKRASVDGINLAMDQRASVDVAMQTGGTTETITVVGENAGQLARAVGFIKRSIQLLVVLVNFIFLIEFNMAAHDDQGLSHEEHKNTTEDSQ